MEICCYLKKDKKEELSIVRDYFTAMKIALDGITKEKKQPQDEV